MSQDRLGKPWTKDEDALLIQAVSVHGEVDNWKTIALSVPGRTNKACRKRWLHSLSPAVKKSAWTKEEDEKLLALYAIHGTKWSVIARQIPGRTDDACSKRYREALDPSLKKDEWTSEEDMCLLNAYSRFGGKWGQIGQELKRSGLACRNRYRLLQRKASSAHSQPTNQPQNGFPEVMMNATQDPGVLQPQASQWMTSFPMLEPGEYWDPSSTDFSMMLPQPAGQAQGASTNSSYLSANYSAPPELSAVPNGVHSDSSSTSPFQYASSSLSAALSLAYLAQGRVGDEPFPDYNDLMGRGQLSFNNGCIQTAPPYNSGPSYQDVTVTEGPETQQRQYSSGGTTPYAHSMNEMQQQSTEYHHEGVAPNRSPTPVPPPIHQEVRPPSPPIDESREVGFPTACRPSPEPVAPVANAQPESTALIDIDVQPSSRYYRTEAQKAREAPQRSSRRPERANSQPRLSATLPASSDSSVLPYACGHEECWPEGSDTGLQCFSTSQALSDHWKSEHNGQYVGSKMFRCALAGCGKGWKSLNGLQYHLQVSKEHFIKALASSTATQEPINDAVEGIKETPKPKKKIHRCPHEGCVREYKQKSGLRYHLTHGHHETPAQLDVVPPTLAKKVAEKMQKEMPTESP
ncbi:hypothetical protein K474DRAFT_1705048 [Panus rudis PR-1116 ss-1]|nr:hypothetical protein K474DRAFT_1705048 [Panus rudis PR-1116 ss-1]